MENIFALLATFGWQLGVIFLMAFFVETGVEFLLGDLFNIFPKLQPYKPLLKYIAVAIGIGMSFYFTLDIIALTKSIIISFTNPGIVPEYVSTPVGIVWTGIAIGKGSNYLHQIVGRFFPTLKDIDG